jgi:hypothetical protein
MKAVEEAGRQALDELRHLLGVLRPEADPDGLGPQPGVADIPRLVDQIRAAGLEVSLTMDRLRTPLPARVELSAYRIVQEALTNTLKHCGPRTRTEVRVHGDADGITVEVLDDGQDGTHNGAKFFEGFRYKQDKSGEWFNQKNSKLGALTEVVKPGYFEDDSIPDLTAEDLEGFEMMCRIKPKKNQAGITTGSTIEWDTMQALTQKEKVAAATAEEDESFSDLPF